jgi:hypothetical protein
MLIAFNAAPGTVAPNGGDSYGPYAKALAEMIREGGLTPANVFDRVRLRVNELTKGAQVPWDASKIESQFIFLERDSAAPPRGDSPAGTAWMRSKPMRSLGADDSYMVALLRDTFDGYADFLADYWNTPMAKRVRAMLATRREAITWRRTYQANVPEAYWSYLKRYPHGPHTADVGRLLAHLGAAIQPPAKFTTMDYDVPSPLPDEFKYIERPALVLDDPEFVFEPPPPSPAYFLEPPPPEFLALAAPAASEGSDSLPNPVFVPLPGYVSAPAYVVASPNSFSFNQTHKTPVISENNNVANRLDGQAVSSLAIVPMSRAGDAKDLAGSPPPPSSAPGMATSPDSQRPPPAVTPEEITAPPNPPLPAMSPTPAVPAANQSLTTARISMRAPTPDNKPRVPPLAITQAPPASGMPTGQPLPVMPSIPPAPADDQSMATARIATRASTSDNLPATRAPSTPGGIPLWARAILSPEAIGSTPLSQPLIDDLILATASIAMRTHTTDDRSPVTGAATRALQASDGVPLSQPLSEMSSLPVVPTDEQLLPTARIATLVRTTDKPPPTPGPEMLAPPATNSIPLLTPAIRSARAPGSIPLPVPRPVTLAPPTTGKVPLPISGPAALQPRAIADQSRQNPPAVSIPPPRAVDSAGQQTAPGKLSSTPALARAPQAVPGVSQPPIQLCPVVNGRRICN